MSDQILYSPPFSSDHPHWPVFSKNSVNSVEPESPHHLPQTFPLSNFTSTGPHPIPWSEICSCPWCIQPSSSPLFAVVFLSEIYLCFFNFYAALVFFIVYMHYADSSSSPVRMSSSHQSTVVTCMIIHLLLAAFSSLYLPHSYFLGLSLLQIFLPKLRIPSQVCF